MGNQHRHPHRHLKKCGDSVELPAKVTMVTMFSRFHTRTAAGVRMGARGRVRAIVRVDAQIIVTSSPL